MDSFYTAKTMTTEDSSVPATKGDVQMILERLSGIQGTQTSMQQDIQSVKALMLAQDEHLQGQISGLATKEDLYAVKEGLQEEIKASERHVLAAVEQKRYDDIGITKDRFTGHDQRIRRLEEKTGLVV